MQTNLSLYSKKDRNALKDALVSIHCYYTRYGIREHDERTISDAREMKWGARIAAVHFAAAHRQPRRPRPHRETRQGHEAYLTQLHQDPD